MNWFVYHIVSGQSFFSGIGLVCLAVFFSVNRNSPLKRIVPVTFIVGTLLIALSSTAIPYWYYACLGVITFLWLFTLFREFNPRLIASLTMIGWIFAAGIEIPYLFSPTLDHSCGRRLSVIGDSVTAGNGGDEKATRWPKILSIEHDIAVQDLSHVGETVASALKRVKQQTLTSDIILLEIGGNDILGETTSSQFSHDLDVLLAYLRKSNRQIIMFELPLPPLSHEYGRIQRTLARKHRVKLVPKRIFLSIIANGESTLDSIHLSQAGHRQMAGEVWKLIHTAFE